MTSWNITEPGMYDMPAEDYHADPVAGGSLSSTGARTIVKSCLAKFHYDQTNTQEDDKKHFTFGRCAHLMVLEPELFAEKVCVVQAENWRTNAAKDARKQAIAKGKETILPSDLVTLKAMRDVIWNDAILSRAFENVIYEKSLFWRDEETGVWCRCRPDILPLSAPFMVDYKTAQDASPDAFTRAIYDHGYHQQAAWYLEGFEKVFNRKLENFWFIAQESKEPFLTGIHRVSPYGLQIGHEMNRLARRKYKQAMESGHWPGYMPDDETAVYFTAEPPVWVAKKYEERVENGFFEPEGKDA